MGNGEWGVGSGEGGLGSVLFWAQPVFYFEAGYASEVPGVVGHHHPTQRQRVPGNHVIRCRELRSPGLLDCLQYSPDASAAFLLKGSIL